MYDLDGFVYLPYFRVRIQGLWKDLQDDNKKNPRRQCHELDGI